MLKRFFELTRNGVPLEAADRDSKAHKGGGSQTTSNEPPAWALPHLEAIGRMGGQLATQPGQYYPGSTVVPFSRQSQRGMNMMEGFTNNQNSLTNQSADQFLNTVRGDYLPTGDRFNAITAPAMDAINGQFSGGGRYGSASHQQGLAKGMMEAVQPYWDSERGRMMTASAMGPGAEMSRTAPMMQVGSMLENQAGMYNQDAMNRWDYSQNEPWNRLSRYAGLITPGAGLGGTQTTTLPGGNRFAGALGGGMSGAMMGSMIPGFGAGAAGATGLAALGPAGIGLGLLGAGLGAFG